MFLHSFKKLTKLVSAGYVGREYSISVLYKPNPTSSFSLRRLTAPDSAPVDSIATLNFLTGTPKDNAFFNDSLFQTLDTKRNQQTDSSSFPAFLESRSLFQLLQRRSENIYESSKGLVCQTRLSLNICSKQRRNIMTYRIPSRAHIRC